VVACRTAAALRRTYATRLLDAVVLGVRALKDVDLAALRRDFPAIPVIIHGAFRPDDGAMLSRLLDQGLATALSVEGVDDPVVGDLVRRHTLSQVRRLSLTDAPRLLRLTEPLQVKAWQRLVAVAGRGVTTEALADSLGISREHLSRQFAAGGAPNLKRVIDLLRLVCAAQLLANPGYDLRAVTRLLDYGTVSHLNAVSRRITGRLATALAGMTPREVVAAFLRVGMRSRK
jgi:AraC-like DNA-binding protein